MNAPSLDMQQQWLLLSFSLLKVIKSAVTFFSHGQPRPNETGSSPPLESQELNSRFLFPIHSLLCFSAFIVLCFHCLSALLSHSPALFFQHYLVQCLSYLQKSNQFADPSEFSQGNKGKEIQEEEENHLTLLGGARPPLAARWWSGETQAPVDTGWNSRIVSPLLTNCGEQPLSTARPSVWLPTLALCSKCLCLGPLWTQQISVKYNNLMWLITQ